MATTTNPPPPLWDSHVVSEYLGVPIGTLDQWAYRGIGPAYMKIGRHRRYRPTEVEQWLDAKRRGGSPDAAA